MSVDTTLRLALARSLAQFVPEQRWFEDVNQAEVWFSAFRVFGLPLDGKLAKHALVGDYEDVRAVFIEWDVHYPHFSFQMLPQTDGTAIPDAKFDGWESTGAGHLLLLLTPLVAKERSDPETSVKERLGLVRAAVVCIMGRNAAFEPAFEMSLRLRDAGLSRRSPAMENPSVLNAPDISLPAVNSVSRVLGALRTVDEETGKRVRLALRWYQRALGDHRSLVVGDASAEGFIQYWLALETLAMPNTTDIGPIKRLLADIHDLSTQEVGELFPIGKIYGLRSEVLHRGEMKSSSSGNLQDFMSDVFTDLLTHILGLPSGERTSKYLDGSAAGLV